MKCDVLIAGGGTGGVAAAKALQGKGLTVVLTEETDWLGGQFTSQIVPPDEHPWIEQFGCTRRYRKFRDAVRNSYRNSLGREWVESGHRFGPGFNPGGGWVSKLCGEPRVFHEQLVDIEQGSMVDCRLRHIVSEVSCENGSIRAVQVTDLKSGGSQWIEPRMVLDATELGDLLPLSGTSYVVGAESRDDTREPHAIDGPAEPDNIQAFTWCAAVGWDPDGDHTIDEPNLYDYWRSFVPQFWSGRLLDLTFPNVRTGAPMTLPLFEAKDDGALTLFGYRQIIDPTLYSKPVEAVTVMNWPQNDYMTGHVIDVDKATRDKHYRGARQLTLSVLYWLQSELGYKGLRLRPDVTGTDDGLAMAPYHRESRRIKSLRTVREQDVSPECNPGRQAAPEMWDSVGVGAYRIDLHPGSNGAKTIDIACLPFQIPLGALIPETTTNLLPACKNIGTTHVTNGCYRLHPVEWNIGESAGLFACFCLCKGVAPQDVYADKPMVKEFQSLLAQEGVELAWPRLGPL